MPSTIPRMSADELKRRLDRGETVVVVDSRSPSAWGRSDERIPGAIRIPPDAEEQHAGEIPRGRMVVTYCT